MKKHIFGLAVFSLIVGAAALVYGIFSASETYPVYEVVSAPLSAPIQSCWKMKNESKDLSGAAIKVNQAVLNLQSKEFSWEIATPLTNAPIALHFFSKDKKGARYITTETVNGSFSRNGLLRFNNTYQWLNKRQSLNNLYVIADSSSYLEVHDVELQPKFDPAKATAVTFNHGVLDYPVVGNVEVR